MASRNDEAVNLLSFDGGGVRGVASLLILNEIMVRIKEIQGLAEVPKPCEYFHMIAGTSTGGLIAIMLGRLRMSTEEALQEYDRCAKKVFAFRNKKWTTATEKFRATALKEVVQDLVRRRNMGEEMEDSTLEHDSKGQCFVCAMPAKEVAEPSRIRSFSSEYNQFASGIKIWEAARATAAASFYFKPMPLRVGRHITEDFIDAAIGCNNPVEYLHKEAADRIGSGRRLGCLVSIGTGTRIVKIDRAATGLRNIAHLPKFIKELLGTLKNTATDGEDAHRRILAKVNRYSNAYFRFNVPDVADQVRLHEHLKIHSLKATTGTYLSDPLVASQILTVAATLARNLSEHGLTLGHLDGLDQDQIVLSTQEPQSFGNISRFFIGRDDILERLDACFAVRDTRGKPRREFLLHGMGGVGKTQTALKAADNMEDRFKFIFHVDGTDTVTAKQSYAKIAQEYCQEESLGRRTTDEMKEAAIRWIEKLSDEWLMIYDNHPDKERLQPLLPRRNSGNIIYTSRSQGFLAELPAEFTCEIKPLFVDDAVRLLLRVAGLEQARVDGEEMKSAQEVVARLGHLPLAIENAGTYIRVEGVSTAAYLEKFRNQRLRSTLLNNPKSDGLLPARPELYTALDLSYDALSALRRRNGQDNDGQSARFALQALNLLCFYHNENIPVAMIKRAAEERYRWGGHGIYPLCDLADIDRGTKEKKPDTDATRLLALSLPDGTWDERSFLRGLQMLQRFSLIKLAPGKRSISVHVMVKEWALDRLDEESQPRRALAARIVLAESIRPDGNLGDQVYLRSIVSHVNACLEHTPATVDVDDYQAHLDFKLGWFYKEEQQFPNAIEHLTKAVRAWKFWAGPCSWTTTFGLGMLANVYREMGRLDDAEMTYRETIDRLFIRRELALLDREASAAREKKRLAKKARRQKLARVLRLGNAADGKVKDMEVMTQDETDEQLQERLSPDAMQLPGFVEDTAAASHRTAKEWEQSVKDILSTAAQKHAGMHLEEESREKWEAELAEVGADLGMLLLDQGRFGAGKKCILQSIRIFKSAGHPRDFRVWALEDELKLRLQPDDLEHWTARYKDMETLSRDEVLQAQETYFQAPMGFATALREMGRLANAYRIYTSTFKRTSRLYGASDRRTLGLMREMAICQLLQGLFTEAEETARTALERARASYGQCHLQTAECLDVLSKVNMCQTLDREPGSELWSITKEAYDSARIAFSDDHYLALQIKRRLDSFSNTQRESLEAGKATEHDEFIRILEGVLAKRVSTTEQEFQAIRDAEYCKYTRKKLQEEEKEEEGDGEEERMRILQLPEGGTRNDGEIRGEAATTRTKKISRPKKRWKGKQKASVTLSPIVEDGLDLHENAAKGRAVG